MISSFSEIRTRQIFLQFMYVAEMQNRSGTVQMMLSETEMAKKEKNIRERAYSICGNLISLLKPI